MRIVWLRESAAVFAGAIRLHQRTNAREDAENIRARRLLREVKRRGLQNEFDLLVERHRLERGAHPTGVSVVPTTVWPCHGMANITRPSLVCGTMMALSPARNERVEHQMHALAGRDDRFHRRIRQRAEGVAERAGGVDHYPGQRFALFARFQIAEAHAVHESVVVFQYVR